MALSPPFAGLDNSKVELLPLPGVQRNVAIRSAFKRTLRVPEAAGGVARFTFDQLCGCVRTCICAGGGQRMMTC